MTSKTWINWSAASISETRKNGIRGECDRAEPLPGTRPSTVAASVSSLGNALQARQEQDHHLGRHHPDVDDQEGPKHQIGEANQAICCS